MNRLNEIESKFNDVVTTEKEGFLALRIPRRRFNFRIFAESVRGIEISKVVEENIKYKKAISEIMITANGEDFGKDLESSIGAKVQGNVIQQFGSKLLNAFISTLQLFWKHIKEFILSFFDIGIKASRLGDKMKKILSRVDKKDPKFKGFIRTDFNKEIKNLPDIDPDDYRKVIHTLTDISGRILISFNYLHKTIKKNFAEKVLDKFRSKDKVKSFEFQNAGIDLKKDRDKLEELKKNVQLDKIDNVNLNMTGEKIWNQALALSSAFEDMKITPKGKTTNLLSNFKKIKELSKKKVLDELILDVQNKFEASDNKYSDNQSILNHLSDIIRRSNKVLVEVHGTGKIYLGHMIKNAGIILKILSENVTIRKPKLDADVNVKVDLSDAFGLKRKKKTY